MSKRQCKDKANIWKSKAILRGEENLYLRKRLKELEASRDAWKEKYKLAKKSSASVVLGDGAKAFGHQYSLTLVSLLMSMYAYGSMSLRSCQHCVGCLFVSLGLCLKVPSHNSIRNWLCKCGYYRFSQSQGASGSYVIYADESIVFGSEKILLILGVLEKNIPQDRSLTHSDMEVLYVGSSQEWKGEDIAVELSKIRENKEIKYVVSDRGCNLLAAYKLLNITHIEDCTHILANYLKGLYEGKEEFEGFCKLVGKLRKDWNLSKENSKYMPPSMRGKMRFANIFPCINWAKNMLEKWQELSPNVQQTAAFLVEKRDFILELIENEKAFKSLCQTLKNNGFGQLQKQEVLAQFKLINPQNYLLTATFIAKCTQYLNLLNEKASNIQQPFLLCSSDIIESYFGKFKVKINPKNPHKLTEFIFTIANFSQNFSPQEIKNALEYSKIKEIFRNQKHKKNQT